MEIPKKAKKLLSTGNIAIGILVIAGVFCIIASIEAMQRNYDLRSKVADETRRRHQLELEIAELEYQRVWRASEEFQELSLKRRFNLANEGEIILELPAPADWVVQRAEEASRASAEELETEELPNWRVWVKFLFGS
ncbi:hypothetical protein FWH09_01390 [Candidatus Saccharibacteria bacterium]|nr:hypothetical protein [Candidatus Saccharibacteria bacterium]